MANIRILRNQKVRCPVEIYLPTDEEAEEQKAIIYVTFKIQPKSVKKERSKKATELLQQLQTLVKAGALEETDNAQIDNNTTKTLDHDRTLEYLQEDILDLEGLEDEDGNSEFTDSHRDFVLDQSYIREPIAEKWRQVQNDELWKKEKQGN